jgi:di/tricarboxylate transporter
MDIEQLFLIGLMAALLVLFWWGRWRYDIVAFAALVVAAVAGTVPYEDVFSGFGHPAVVTVAVVLVISRGLQNSGAVDLIARHLLPPILSPSRHVGMLTGVAGTLSTVMNNVGALVLLMPAALKSAAKANHAPAVILMPLAFGSILGGLITLIGTPPNIIISAFRREETGTAFGMFDFAPVGGIVAVAGIAYIAIIGWRLIPEARRVKRSEGALFDIDDYVSEVRVVKGSKAVGQSLGALDEAAAKHEAVILRHFRKDQRVDRPNRMQEVRAGDLLVVETGPQALGALVSELGLKLAGASGGAIARLSSGETVLAEAVVLPRSRLVGQPTGQVTLRRRYGVNLIAISRQGHPLRGRLHSISLKPGDVLLLEGFPERLPEIVTALGCLPLAGRDLKVAAPRRAILSLALFAGGIALATFGLMSLPVALGAVATGLVLLNIVPPRDIYESVDWPVIVLLAAMIPIGNALETSGTTGLVTDTMLMLGAELSPLVILAFLMVVTIALSNIINNAATAVVMGPVGLTAAEKLSVSPDPFLMAVAVAASCAFLTPIGHQNNTLILGPGGYEFGDYWRVGLPLTLLIVIISVPLIPWVWPF